MKAYLSYQVHCPSCDFVMVREGDVVYCGSLACRNYRVPYERPFVELRQIEMDELEELAVNKEAK